MGKDLYVVAELKVPKDYRKEFIAFAKGLVENTLKETGNISYVLTESADDPCKFVVLEHWKSQQALDEHCTMPHFVQLVQLINDKSLDLTINTLTPVL